MSPMLAAKQISVGYAGTPAVHDIDIEVHKGEILTILGANGAGKTTLLLGLAGALPLLGGSVTFDDQPLSDKLSNNAKRGMGLLTDDRAIFKDLSVIDNLRLGRGNTDLALHAFPALEALASRRAGLLSGGEQQMLGLGRIIAGRPKVLLADELSLGLAPVIVSSLLEAVRRLAGEGTAVILVEQHVRLVLGIADRGVVLRRGEIAISAPAADLLAQEDRIAKTYLHAPDESVPEASDSGDHLGAPAPVPRRLADNPTTRSTTVDEGAGS